MSRKLVTLLLIILPFILNAQTERNHYLEFNTFLAELQTKNSLFEFNNYFERATLGAGAEFNYGISIKNKLGIQIGLNFFIQSSRNRFQYDLEIRNPDNDLAFENQYKFEFSNTLIDYEVDFILEVNHINCTEISPSFSDGSILKMTMQKENRINQIGVPMKIEKLVGKGDSKLYIGLGLSYNIIWDTSSKSNNRDRHTSHIGYEIRRCQPNSSNLVNASLQEFKIDITNHNLIKNRIDYLFELGMLHEMPKNALRLVLFYEESITGYSEINQHQIRIQQVGLKIGIRNFLGK